MSGHSPNPPCLCRGEASEEPANPDAPPEAVHVAGLDPLRDEGIAYAEALQAAGVQTDLHTYKGLPHGFYGAVGLPETLEYFKLVAAFVQKCAARDSRL